MPRNRSNTRQDPIARGVKLLFKQLQAERRTQLEKESARLRHPAGKARQAAPSKQETPRGGTPRVSTNRNSVSSESGGRYGKFAG